MNILITGGAGFIGSNLSLKLIEKGHTVTVLDNLSPQIHGENPENSPLYMAIKDNVRFIKGDVRIRDDWSVALKGQDAVVHYAAETGTGQSMYEIERYVDVNIKGTGILLDILANDEHTIKKIVVASSRSIYGEGKYSCPNCGIVYPNARIDDDMLNEDFAVKCPQCSIDVEILATDEESKIHPSSLYGITKQNQEQMVMIMGNALNIPAVAFRYQNVYGPGQSLSNPYTGILSIFSTLIMNGKTINIFEDGKESRDFVYIDDVISATIMGIEDDRANGHIFNVGYGEPVDVLTVAQTLVGAYDKNVEIKVSGQYRLGDIRHNYADLKRIEETLGFKPSYSFKSGITKFANWVITQNIQKDTFEKSLSEMAGKGLLKGNVGK